MQKNHGKSKTSQRFSRFQESDYMDPKQGLCLGALFDIAATNVTKWYNFFTGIPELKLYLMHAGIHNIGAWYGQKALHHRVLPFHRNAKWCCGRHCFGAWWGGIYTIFFFPFGNHFNFYPYCALNITRSPWSCALGSKTISCFLLQPQHLVLLSIERIAWVSLVRVEFIGFSVSISQQDSRICSTGFIIAVPWIDSYYLILTTLATMPHDHVFWIIKERLFNNMHA